MLDQEAGTDSSRTMELAAGWNQILAKTYSGKGEWCFRLSVESMSIEPLTGILCRLPHDIPSTRKAALLSMLLPGLGHIYLDDVKEGILLLGGEVALISSSFLFNRYVLENSSDSSERSDFRLSFKSALNRRDRTTTFRRLSSLPKGKREKS